MTDLTQDLIPSFEGHPVAKTAVRVSGKLITDDLAGIVLRHDDIVQVLTQFRVVGVNFSVDETSGEITRIQLLRPVEMVLAPIDPDDPDDIGIIRALPHGSVTSNRPTP